EGRRHDSPSPFVGEGWGEGENHHPLPCSLSPRGRGKHFSLSPCGRGLGRGGNHHPLPCSLSPRGRGLGRGGKSSPSPLLPLPSRERQTFSSLPLRERAGERGKIITLSLALLLSCSLALLLSLSLAPSPLEGEGCGEEVVIPAKAGNHDAQQTTLVIVSLQPVAAKNG